ncbi:NAD(P)/FAD-dependent oxidoreductase [Deinococcus sp. KSM4-11]|uniref:phytoene desaturase family protein n=1 Tax=Deinococcus sp. KSM4-11 TaxID=2568654 RepID=UPI001F1047D2|nr:NAD(P)/FAD-dependent oxidoreductase [Deinococcus sp. KSM4-11]
MIGGGLAGLALAALLAQRGHSVTVYDRDRAGGKLRRESVGGLTFDTGPSLFTFPDVWRAYLARLGERDPLDLRPIPGGLGMHHTPFGSVALPVPEGHALFHQWQRYLRAVAPLRPHVTALLTTPPDLGDPTFRRASWALLRVIGPHLTAASWLRDQNLAPALEHALATHALNAGLAPQEAPALYALIPGLLNAEVFAPALGMGTLLDALQDMNGRRGVAVREAAEIVRLRDTTVTLACGEATRHDVVVSAIDPVRLAALRNRSLGSPVARRTVSGLALYVALTRPLPLPATSIVAPDDFTTFREAMRAGALPPTTLALVHHAFPRLAVLLSTPATGRSLAPDHPWVQTQLHRLERMLDTPGLRSTGVDTVGLSPDHYAAGGHPGGAIYGLGLPPWRAGPFHPQPYRVARNMWQVGTGVHPGGGIPAILGGALMVDTLMAR